MNLRATDALRKLVPGWLKRIGSQALTSNTIAALIKKQGLVRCKLASILVDHPRITNAEAASIFFGIRERAEIDIVNKMLSIGNYTTVIELGSSIGVISANIAQHSPQRMICLEADPELMELCQQNVKCNATDKTEMIFLNKVIDYSSATKSIFKAGKTTTSGKLHDASSAAPPLEHVRTWYWANK